MNSLPTVASESFGWIERPGRLRIDVSGPDRLKFLNNLATNEIRRLEVGRGCEMFITSPQGKTLGFGTILAADDRLIVRTEAVAGEFVLPHLKKYGIFDDVSVDEVTGDHFEIVVSGPKGADLLGFPTKLPELEHRPGSVAGREIIVIHDDPTGRQGLTILGHRRDYGAVSAFLGEHGQPLELEMFEAMRIEAGTPAFGKDVTIENLPQEIGRDARAISFVKGCYLGQETVARIDALGHVNKILRGLRIEGDTAPPPGSTLEFEGKAVGKVTSSAFSEALACPVALAMVRIIAGETGTRLDVVAELGRSSAIVVDLPMIALT